MPRKPRATPRERSVDWSVDIEIDASLFDAPDVRVVRAFVANLKQAMDGRSEREVGRLSGVDYTTINRILHGLTWPDMQTIARLEAGLGADLWPGGVAKDAAERAVLASQSTAE